MHLLSPPQVVEDGYEFFAKRQLVTLFSAPNYCGEFDNAGAMMSVDESLMCSFQVRFNSIFTIDLEVIWKSSLICPLIEMSIEIWPLTTSLSPDLRRS